MFAIITEYEDKHTWMPLEKAGRTNDERQQCGASYKRNTIYFVIS